MIAYYPFNGNANDECSYTHNGIVRGTSLTKDRKGNLNSAYLFDGRKDYIEITNFSAINNLDAFTLSSWIYPTDYNHYITIVSKASPNRDFVLRIYGNNGYDHRGHASCEFVVGKFYNCFTPVIPLKKWTHLLATWNGIDWKIYVNGKLSNTCNHENKASSRRGRTMEIGALNGRENFEGMLDEIIIYDCAATEEEVLDIFNSAGSD